jgi:hypothetical protein
VSINNPGISVNGLIVLAGDHFDINGNLIPNGGKIGIRIINGAVAMLSVTLTSLAPPVGAVAIAGVAPTVSVS